jgi:hypothetical protein
MSDRVTWTWTIGEDTVEWDQSGDTAEPVRRGSPSSEYSNVPTKSATHVRIAK